MSPTEVPIVTPKTIDLLNEHAARFAIMVNAGRPPAEAIAESLNDLAAETGFDPAHMAVMLWGALLHDLVGIEVHDEEPPA